MRPVRRQQQRPGPPPAATGHHRRDVAPAAAHTRGIRDGNDPHRQQAQQRRARTVQRHHTQRIGIEGQHQASLLAGVQHQPAEAVDTHLQLLHACLAGVERTRNIALHHAGPHRGARGHADQGFVDPRIGQGLRQDLTLGGNGRSVPACQCGGGRLGGEIVGEPERARGRAGLGGALQLQVQVWHR